MPSVRVHTSSPSCSGSLKYGMERDGRSPTSQPGVEKERVSSFLGIDGKAIATKLLLEFRRLAARAARLRAERAA